MNLNDMFGPNPNRPNTPEFWALSEIVLKFDGRTDAQPTEEGKQGVWDEAMASAGMQGETIAYMGMQRAFRILGVQTRGDLVRPGVIETVQKITAAYMEAFIVGSQFERQRQGKLKELWLLTVETQHGPPVSTVHATENDVKACLRENYLDDEDVPDDRLLEELASQGVQPTWENVGIPTPRA